MRRYGVPKGVNAQELRYRIDKIFSEFDAICKDPQFQHEAEVFAQSTGSLSPESLGKRFTI